MKILPAGLITAKNDIDSPVAWLLFIDVTLTDGTVYYLVNNNTDISFFKYVGGVAQTYTATFFDIDSNKENLKGELPTVTLRIQGVDRILATTLDTLDGAIGSSVILRVVSSENLDVNYAQLTWVFDVVGTSSDVFYVTFQLGAPNPMRKRFPLYRYIADSCNWKFRSAECSYLGTWTVCNRTLAACQIRSNSTRYGGFPGIGAAGSVRIV